MLIVEEFLCVFDLGCGNGYFDFVLVEVLWLVEVFV